MTSGFLGEASVVEVGLVGLGTIAETHLAVLAGLPQVMLSFVVDPDPARSASFRDAAPPRYEHVSEALARHRPDLVVIATPTHTHAELAREVLSQSQARVLVEKPLAHDLGSLALIRSVDPGLDAPSRLLVAHHFAFAPEVAWAAGQLTKHRRSWGPMTRITSVFHDPYVNRLEQARTAYVSSWVDSGANQLSMLSRFVNPIELRVLRESENGTSSWSVVTFRSGAATGSARLRTSWHAATSSKKTTLELGQSGVELWLDHTAMTGLAMRGDQMLGTFGREGHTPPPQSRALSPSVREPALSDARPRPWARNRGDYRRAAVHANLP